MRKALPPVGDVAELGATPLAVFALLVHQEAVHQAWADEHGIAMPGTVLKIAHLAEKIGIGRPTVSKAIRKLCAGGYITVEGDLHGRGSTHKTYRVARSTRHLMAV